MKTTNEIKDEVAKSHGYDSWEDLLDCVEVKITRRPVLIQLENEAMEAYAQQFREGDKIAIPNNDEIDVMAEREVPMSEEFQKYSDKEKILMMAAFKAGAKWFRENYTPPT